MSLLVAAASVLLVFAPLDTAAAAPSSSSSGSGLSTSFCYSDNTTQGFKIPLEQLGASADYGLCKRGWYCPFLDPSYGNESYTWPKICPPSNECWETRIAGEFCEPQGPHEPQPCHGGFYCPTATQLIRCPKGYFCPIGSTAPRKCSPFASCPEGTSNDYSMVGIFLVVLIDGALIGIVLFYRHQYQSKVEKVGAEEARKNEIQRKASEAEEGRTTTWGSINQGASGSSTAADFKPLFDLFKKARDGATSLTFRFTNLSVKIPKIGARETSNQPTASAAASLSNSIKVTSAANPNAPSALDSNSNTNKQAEDKDRTLLQGVTGRFRPGTVTAIMGPSGAGKTVLLNTLLAKNSTDWKQEGGLTVNRKLTVGDIRHVVGFVPQDDVLHNELTVEQNLYYSSETRLPQHFTAEEREALRNHIIKALDLESSRHVRIGDGDSRGVSGGQRKRCSIGVEMVACPTALFLDEPTSGLDAATALDLCRLLQLLSSGTDSTIVMVVHQPRAEIWNALDQVLLLAPGGRTVYQGPQCDAKEYFQAALGLNFENGNPADIIIDGISAHGDLCVEMWDAKLQQLESNVNYDGTQSPLKASAALPGPADADAANFQDANPATPETTALQQQQGNYSNREEHAHPQNEPTVVGAAPPPMIIDASAAAANDGDYELEPISPQSPHGAGQSRNDTIVIPPVRGASFAKQVWLSIHRLCVKNNTHPWTFALDVALAVVTCIVMSTAKIRDEWTGIITGPYALVAPKHKIYTLPMITMFYMLAVASSVAPAGIRTFGNGMVQYWREASSGYNRFAYFLGYTIVDFLRCLISSLHFALVAYLMAEPIQTFWSFWLFIALLFLCVDSQSAALSMYLQPDTAPLLSTVIAVFMGLLNGYASIPIIGPISYAWYVTEGILHENTEPVSNIYDVGILEKAAKSWNLRQLGTDIIVLFVIYFLYRLVAFCMMIGLNREKQR